MLTSRSAVYLTGDFGITDYFTRQFTVKLDTQKLIPVIRFGWAALIAYTGVASVPPLGHDTGAWVLAQMDTIPMDGSFNELPKRLLAANDWLSKIRDPAPRELAFLVVGFVERRPFMMLASNFLDLDGNITHLRPQLELFQRRPKQPEVLVPGDINAVQLEEKEHLKLLSKRNADPKVIRANLAEVNAKAAQRAVGISEECVTGHLLPSGTAEIQPHGIGDREAYLPGFVIRDLVKNGIIGFVPKYDEEGNPLPPRWVGMTARIQGARGRNATVGVIHAVRNVGKPLSDGIKRKGQAAAWKIAGPDEPRSYTFTVKRPPTKKK